MSRVPSAAERINNIQKLAVGVEAGLALLDRLDSVGTEESSTTRGDVVSMMRASVIEVLEEVWWLRQSDELTTVLTPDDDQREAGES
jgi:hypothetical protein